MEGNRTGNAVGTEVRLRFEGLGSDLFGWGVLAVLVMIAVQIPGAWLSAAIWRWGARNIKFRDNSSMAFVGVPADVWYWFPLMGIISVLQGALDGPQWDWPLGALYVLVTLYAEWRIMRWWAQGFRVRESYAFTFTGPLTQFALWQIASMVSVLTIVGWAWVEVAKQRWIFRNMQSGDVQLRFNGAPYELLILGLRNIGLPAAAVLLLWWLDYPAWIPVLVAAAIALPWLYIPILRWWVANTVAIMPEPQPPVDIFRQPAETTI